jgi:RNA polymerase sigma-70 factor, ECF subfamily
MTAVPPIEVLYQRNRLKALKFVARVLKDADEAEDVVQDIFLRLHRGDHCGRQAQSEAWFNRVVLNSSINSLRSSARRKTLTFEPDIAESPEAYALQCERRQALLEAMVTLSTQHQSVLKLRELEGLSYPEISNRLGMKLGTIKSALSRARTQLARALASASSEITSVGNVQRFDGP